MAIDVNNPMEFQSPDTTAVRDFAHSTPADIINELQHNGGQTLIVEGGRFVARIEPIPQDMQTQSDLNIRFGNTVTTASIPTSAPYETIASDDRLALVSSLVEQARKAAELNEQQ